MTAPTTKTISTTLILNEDNANTARLQVCSRAAGRVPAEFLGEQTVSLARLNQELAPLERTAVLYLTAGSSITAIFIRLLAPAKLEREKQTRVITLKTQLINLFNRYANTDPQLNILKLLSLRFFANINRLLKDPAFKACHMRLSPTAAAFFREVNVSTLSDSLKLCVQHLSNYILLLELEVERKEHIWPTPAPISVCQQTIVPLLEVITDRNTRSCIRELKNDLELLDGLTLAPEILLPLAIMPFGSFSRTSSLAFQEIGKLLRERLELISSIVTDTQAYGVKELSQFCRAFLCDYQPGMQKLFQTMQQIFQQTYIVKGRHANEHPHACQKLLDQLNVIPHPLSDQPSLSALTALFRKLSSVKAKEVSLRLIDTYTLPVQAITMRYRQYLYHSLVSDLDGFSLAYASYLELIPHEQREMQTDLYTPCALLVWNIINRLESLVERIDDSEDFTKLLNILLLVNLTELNATHWYQTAFPHFTEAYEQTLKVLEEGKERLRKVQEEFKEKAILSSKDLTLLEQTGQLLHCFHQFLDSHSSYPFLFGPLGSGILQDNSYEHTLTAEIAFSLYKRIRGFKETYSLPQITVSLPGEKKTCPQGASVITLKSSFELCCLWVAQKLNHNWQEIKMIDTSTFITHYPSLTRLIRPFEDMQNNLPSWQLEDQEALSLDTTLESGWLKPYQFITHYFNLLTLPAQTSSSSQPRRQIQKKKKTASITPQPIPPKPRREPRISPLTSYIQTIRESLALPTSLSQVESLECMRDCHDQVSFHLDALEDLFSLLKRKESCSFDQLHSLLVHQAIAIEQAVKLAALTRAKTEAKARELQGLLKSTHQPSQFFERFLPHPTSTLTESRWQKAREAACAVDHFLAVPARYATGFHKWMDLLDEWDYLESSSEEKKTKYQEIKTLIKTNVDALTVLLEDVSHSLPAPKKTGVTPSLLEGTVEGLLARGCLKMPEPTIVPSFDFGALEASLDCLKSIQRVSPLSPYETTAHLISRRKQLRYNLHVLSINKTKIERLLEEKNPTSWCSSYTPNLLLSGAVCLEQSIQALLFWLPVSSPQEPDLHYLLSDRPGADGRPLLLWKVHSIQENADRAIEGLKETGKTALANHLQQIRDRLTWIEPLIKTLYRYPCSPEENRSSDTLRLFRALALIRRAIRNETLSEGSRKILQEELSPSDPEADLLTAFDALIEAHIQTQVVSAHELLQASSDVLAMLQELTNTR